MSAAGPAALIDYYGHLDAGDARDAAACFSDDVVYVVPASVGSGPTRAARVVRGRAGLLDAFLQRGRLPHRHHLERWVSRGSSGVAEGHVAGLPGGTTARFVATATLDESGSVSRYAVATMAMERVAWTSAAPSVEDLAARVAAELDVPLRRCALTVADAGWAGTIGVVGDDERSTLLASAVLDGPDRGWSAAVLDAMPDP